MNTLDDIYVNSYIQSFNTPVDFITLDLSDTIVYIRNNYESKINKYEFIDLEFIVNSILQYFNVNTDIHNMDFTIRDTDDSYNLIIYMDRVLESNKLLSTIPSDESKIAFDSIVLDITSILMESIKNNFYNRYYIGNRKGYYLKEFYVNLDNKHNRALMLLMFLIYK